MLETTDDVTGTDDSVFCVVELDGLLIVVDRVKENALDEDIEVDSVDRKPESELTVLSAVLDSSVGRSNWVITDDPCEELNLVRISLCTVVTTS